MQAGKHVYTAVPIIMPPSGSGDEILGWCDRVIDCAKRTGQYYMMGETTYFRPESMLCRKRGAAGEFGHFVYMEAEYLHDTWLPAYLVNEFVRACVDNRMPAVNAWEAARYVAAGVMAHKSALKGGELLKVPDWGDAPGN